ncbi:hypothetical protein BMS3Abin02_00296 [bacterium BMS3Abin02]|nr:hypothetical protein BMS3Abin02_00296 [bacterium BMS3Abin02]
MTYTRSRQSHIWLFAVVMLSLAVVMTSCSSSSVEPASSSVEPASSSVEPGSSSAEPTVRIRLSGSYAEYSSVEELAAAADVIVVATAGDTAHRAVEGDPANPGSGIPMVYREFSVDDILFDPNGYIEGATFYVSLFDTDKLIVDEQSDIKSGQRLLLFLDRVSADEVPAIRPLKQVFSPLSSDNGVFDVNDANEVTARSPAVTSLRKGESIQDKQPVVGSDGEERPTATSDVFSASLEQVREVITTASP